MNGEDAPQIADPLTRYRRWAAVITALAALGYVAYAGFKGFVAVGGELYGFRWSLYVPVLLLTLVNYGLRFCKWNYLLKKVGVQMPLIGNLWVFGAGLAMVISPGKAGEVVKPYLVKTITGVSMTRTLPALVAERATDGIAVVILAAVGVSTFYADQALLIYGTLAATAAGIVAMTNMRLVHALIRPVQWVSHRTHARLLTAYDSMRACLEPVPLAVTILVSLAAWWAECVGLWLVFQGLGLTAGLDLATFLYAFATVFGAPMPGGMGMADVAIAEGAQRLVTGITPGEALAASLLIRVATLWLGVLLGVVALLRIEPVISRARAALGA